MNLSQARKIADLAQLKLSDAELELLLPLLDARWSLPALRSQESDLRAPLQIEQLAHQAPAPPLAKEELEALVPDKDILV